MYALWGEVFNLVKVIVVDDEYLAREGMKRTINWAKYGCVFCGEAGDGCEGIELAEKVRPDLIITDIKMPGIDGIHMAQKIKEKLPDCKFIIITGYDDFEYARGAVKVNAVDFLLKPVDENEFINAVEKASKECNKTRENIILTREKKLLNIMRGNIEGKDNIDAELLDIGVCADNILIVNFKNESYEKYRNSEIIKSIIKKHFPDKSYLVECHEDKVALIVSAGIIKDSDDICRAIRNIQKEIYEDKKIVITAGVSNINSIYDLSNAYNESKEALKCRMYMGKGSIIYYDKLKEENLVKWNSIIEIEKEIIIKLKACDRTELEKHLKKLYFGLFKENNIDYSTIKQTSIHIVLKSIDVLYEYGISPEKLFDKNFNIYRSTARLQTIKELYMFVKDVLERVLDCIKENNISAYESGIENALNYIKEHFCENISLSDVAKVAFLNESYLSRKIKKTLGINFTEYITKLRMEKAIEYFKDPNIKITDAAYRLGYQDYRYFSQTFKKYTGYLPSEWKEKQITD